MDRGSVPPLRSLPRLFVAEATPVGPFPLPKEEWDKLHHVLRLNSGAWIAVLPGDGTVLRCRLQGRQAEPVEQIALATEPTLHLTLAQALPKPDKLDEVVRMGTELGVSRFVVFPSERTVARWDEKKVADRFRRLAAIAREAAEVAFRARLPELEWRASLAEVLASEPNALVLSEQETVTNTLTARMPEERATLVIGPEGGWAPREVAAIGDLAVTLGPRVLRVDTAAAAAIALSLHATQR